MIAETDRQSQRIRALEATLERPLGSLERVDTLNELAWELRIAQPKRAYALAQQAHGLSGSGEFVGLPYLVGKAAALVTQAFVDVYEAKLGQATSKCLATLPYLETAAPPVAWRLWFTWAWTTFFLNDYPTALDHALKALRLARELGGSLEEAWSLDVLAAVYSVSDDLAKALSTHEASLELFRQLGETAGEVRALHNLAVALYMGEQCDRALEHAQESMRLAQALGLEIDVCNTTGLVASILVELGRLEEAAACLDRIMPEYLSNPILGHVYAVELAGRIAEERGDLEGADRYFKEALELAERLNHPLNQYRCHRLLYKLRERQGRFAEALEHFKRFHELYVAVFGEQATKRFEALKFTYQLEAARQEAEIHRLQSVALQLQVEEQERQQARLEHQARTDPLTGLANRRHFDEVLETEYARHSRSGLEMSLILLDVDAFKAFNDFYGHLSGDECLRLVAGALKRAAHRASDLVARYGGEEFACILPETGPAGAQAVAEQIRQEVMKLAIPHRRSQVAEVVTVSLGVITARCVQGEPAAHLVALADEQLYAAKSDGRNRFKARAVGQD